MCYISFEIILLQVWIISITFFESLNVATQAMAAGFLGRHDRASAREVLQRALHLSCFAGLLLGLLLFVTRGPLVSLFTKDAAVAVLGGAVMPVIALCMPVDAGASIMDGGLIAAGQTNALSVIQVAGSLIQYAVLALLVARGFDSVAYVWGVLKVLSLARLGGGYWLHFVSRRSAYLPKAGLASQQQQQQSDAQVAASSSEVSSSSSDSSVMQESSSDNSRSSSGGSDSSSCSSSSSSSAGSSS
jgi:Na+-driven multidrug efflux pump